MSYPAPIFLILCCVNGHLKMLLLFPSHFLHIPEPLIGSLLDAVARFDVGGGGGGGIGGGRRRMI